MMHRFLAIVVLMICHVLSGHLGHAADEVKALRMIIVPERQQAEEILKQLKRGASFSALAGTKSIGPERRTWGYSGTVRLKDLEPTFRAALQKLRTGQISDVLELRQQFVIIKVISPKIEQHYEAASRATRQGKVTQALRELQAALPLEKDNVQTHIRLGTLYDSAKQYEQAIHHLELAQSYVPEVAQIMIVRAAVYTRAAIAEKNRTYARKALEVYKEALEANERLAPAVHFGMGKIYLLGLQQPKTALTHLEKAVKVSPNVSEVYRLLIQAHYDTRNYDKAWENLRLAQSLGFEFPDLLATLHKVKQGAKP